MALYKEMIIFSRYIDSDNDNKKVLVFLDNNKKRFEFECDNDIFYNAVLFAITDIEIKNKKISSIKYYEN